MQVFNDYLHPDIIGRQEEQLIFGEILNSNKPELVAVYGRRRVGKTYLIRTYFQKHICFELSGTIKADAAKQLYNFAKEFGKHRGKKMLPQQPANWQEAFTLLEEYLEALPTKKRKVVFFDELPWLDTMHSGFLAAFDYFWNSWCTKRKDIVVVVCGSAASWMIEKLVNDMGGLHNRITQTIQLQPFTLSETRTFLTAKNFKIDEYKIAQLYMVMGGIPHYLEALKPSKSVILNIDTLCFSEKGLLRNEFDNLYKALFKNAHIHISIIRSLATKRTGLLRNEIIKTAKLKSGGYITEALTELIESGFISTYVPLNNKAKEAVYRLTDEYSLFYLKFIENSKFFGTGSWDDISKTQSYISWSGYAFETLCLKHVQFIKNKLGIGTIYTQHSAWYNKSEKAQIDLVITRSDRCINLCEMKFSKSFYTFTVKDAKDIERKMLAYKTATKTNDTIYNTFITSYGIKQNKYSINSVDNQLTLKDLF